MSGVPSGVERVASPAADGLSDDAVRDLLRLAKRIAVVGVSLRPERPSHGVFRFLAARKVALVGVNPAEAGRTIAGAPVGGSLQEATDRFGTIDIVDVFRRADEIPRVARDAIAVGAGAFWMQLGLAVPAAAAAGRAAGLVVVMNCCTAMEWARLRLPLA